MIVAERDMKHIRTHAGRVIGVVYRSGHNWFADRTDGGWMPERGPHLTQRLAEAALRRAEDQD